VVGLANRSAALRTMKAGLVISPSAMSIRAAGRSEHRAEGVRAAIWLRGQSAPVDSTSQNGQPVTLPPRGYLSVDAANSSKGRWPTACPPTGRGHDALIDHIRTTDEALQVTRVGTALSLNPRRRLKCVQPPTLRTPRVFRAQAMLTWRQATVAA
jgi:hypothetical protein